MFPYRLRRTSKRKSNPRKTVFAQPLGSYSMPESIDVLMPKWGMNMIEGTLVDWLKSIGDGVQVGEAIASIETDKVEAQIESPVEGVLVEQCVLQGEQVAVG